MKWKKSLGIFLSLVSLNFFNPIQPLFADGKLHQLQVNDWFYWEKDWESREKYPGKSLVVYRVDVRPGETYALSLKLKARENTRFSLGYSDSHPFDGLISTNHRSTILETDTLEKGKDAIHHRLIKIDEKSKGRQMYVYLAVEQGAEPAIQFGIRVSYLAFAGLTPQNQNTFVNEGKIYLEDVQALKEETWVKHKGSAPGNQDLFERIPLLKPQNGYFFPVHLTQFITPREGLLTRGGVRSRLPEYEEKNQLETQRIYLVDSEYTLQIPVYLKKEETFTVWVKSFSDNQFFWGSRELEIYLNNEHQGDLVESESQDPSWTWQKAGRFQFKNGLNHFKFRKKESTGAIAVIDKILISRDPYFSPGAYDRIHHIVTPLDSTIGSLKELELRPAKKEELVGKWNYEVKNQEAHWSGQVVIQQEGKKVKIMGFARRLSDNRPLTWVEEGTLEGRLLKTQFQNRYLQGEATYNLSKDQKSLYGVWAPLGKEETGGVIQMNRKGSS